MDFEVHCMFILPTELSLFNYEKVTSGLQSINPLRKICLSLCSSSNTMTIIEGLAALVG